jgi:putative thiamine transport system ATP-binding protein
MSHVIGLEEIRISLDGRMLLAIDAEIGAGEVFTVMGPSGVGKSTLLAAVAGFIDPVFDIVGRVLLDGEDITGLEAEERHVGLLFQDALLFPHLSIGGNLAFGLAGRHRDRQQRIDLALDEIGLAGFADRDPATLSGGERSRVALMRLLLSEPRAVLLDEPFSKLDAALRQDMRELVFGRLRAAGLPAILVTHDAADAEAAGGRIIELG